MNEPPTDASVSLIGVGDMGTAIALALIDAGWTARGYDISPERRDAAKRAGIEMLPNASALLARSDLVLIAVDGEPAFRSVAAEMVDTARADTVIVVHTTVRPDVLVEFADKCSGNGVSVLDAAVNGGSERARLGRLTLMIGGEEAAVDRAWPALSVIAEHLFRLGPPGAGMAAKLVNNVLGISSYAMLLEAMQLAAAYGMDEDVVTGFVSQSWGDSRHVHAWGRQDRRRRERLTADAQAYTRMSRDLANAAAAARMRHVDMPLTEAAAELLPDLLRARDTDAARWRLGTPAPRCSVCGIELAAPFRSAGVHPECIP